MKKMNVKKIQLIGLAVLLGLVLLPASWALGGQADPDDLSLSGGIRR